MGVLVVKAHLKWERERERERVRVGVLVVNAHLKWEGEGTGSCRCFGSQGPPEGRGRGNGFVWVFW